VDNRRARAGAATLCACTSSTRVVRTHVAPHPVETPARESGLGLADVRSRRQHTFNGKTTLTQATARRLQTRVVLPDGRRGHCHSDRREPAPCTSVRGTTNSTPSTSRPAGCAGSIASAPKTRSRPIPVSARVTQAPTEDWSRRQHGMSRGAALRPDLVIFGGGYTLYALNADTGSSTGVTTTPAPRPTARSERGRHRIFSSPVVADGRRPVRCRRRRRPRLSRLRRGRQRQHRKPCMGVSDRHRHARTAAQRRLWQRVVIRHGAPPVGPRSVRLRRLRLLEHCAVQRGGLRPHINDGHPCMDLPTITRRRPVRPRLRCHTQRRTRRQRERTVLRSRRQDGTYYSLDPTPATPLETNVYSAGSPEGSSPPPHYDGSQIYGSTAIGDFGRFERNGNGALRPEQPPRPGQPKNPPCTPSTRTPAPWNGKPTTAARSPRRPSPEGLTFNGPALDGPTSKCATRPPAP